MSPDLLARIGIALFDSEDWKLELCKALQVNIRTMRRWANGSQPMPEWLREDLIEILAAKRAAISMVLRELTTDKPVSAK